MLLPRTSAEGVEGEQEDPRRELVSGSWSMSASRMRPRCCCRSNRSKPPPGPTRRSGNLIRRRDRAGDRGRTPSTWCVFSGKSSTARGGGRCSTSTRTLSPSPRCSTMSAGRLIMEDRPVSLSSLLRKYSHREGAYLHVPGSPGLVRLQAVLLRQDNNFGEVYIKKHASFESGSESRPTSQRRLALGHAFLSVRTTDPGCPRPSVQ